MMSLLSRNLTQIFAIGCCLWLLVKLWNTSWSWRGDAHLRILPLGDSITQGYGSSDENGYRLRLLNLLEDAGKSVEFVGSQESGTHNLKNRHDGWNGAKIHQIASNAALHGSLRTHPNIVLIHAGANDMQDDEPGPNEQNEFAMDRLSILIDEVLCECPDAVLFLSKLSQQSEREEWIDWYNTVVEDVYNKYKDDGVKIKLVDHSGVKHFDLMDGLHPNDAGYHKMAVNWDRAIRAVPKEWITTARKPSTGLNDQTCPQDDMYWYRLNHHEVEEEQQPADPNIPLAQEPLSPAEVPVTPEIVAGGAGSQDPPPAEGQTDSVGTELHAQGAGFAGTAASDGGIQDIAPGSGDSLLG